MTKIIYMEQTLAFIHSQNPDAVNDIVMQSTLHETKDGIRYLVKISEESVEKNLEKDLVL